MSIVSCKWFVVSTFISLRPSLCVSRRLHHINWYRIWLETDIIQNWKSSKMEDACISSDVWILKAVLLLEIMPKYLMYSASRMNFFLSTRKARNIRWKSHLSRLIPDLVNLLLLNHWFFCLRILFLFIFNSYELLFPWSTYTTCTMFSSIQISSQSPVCLPPILLF